MMERSSQAARDPVNVHGPQGPGAPDPKAWLRSLPYEPGTVQEEANRSRPAAGGDQQGVGAGEGDPSRPPLDAVTLVGATGRHDGTVQPSSPRSGQRPRPPGPRRSRSQSLATEPPL